MVYNRIGKVLIANRGEIALRIQRTCQKMGIKTATTVSEIDRKSLFARKAEEVALLPGSNARETYLNSDLIIKLAIKLGYDSIHPGYGFLSENADFAENVNKAGLIFIGPSSRIIALLGNKVEARKVLTKYGVPCTPGSETSEIDEILIKSGEEIGFPVIIKAALGGGGRGMRVASSKKQLIEELPRARSEALKFFGDSRIYLEKLIDAPRHIEVQLLGDKHGNIIHLGTRECSTQRRSQKLVEEAPAPNLSDKIREGLHQAAIKAGKAAKYDSVGTAEFLVKDQSYYFLEMNTRIQVEHTVTEEISGIDLIEEQIKLAAGEKLSFKQKNIKLKGHSIEFRVNAEESRESFRPAIGEIGQIKKPTHVTFREEQGFEQGDSITPFYDGLITKLIVNGENRRDAIVRGRELLKHYKIANLPTTLEFHRWLLIEENFLKSKIDIGFVERNFTSKCIDELLAREAIDPKFIPPSCNGDVERIEYYEYSSKSFNYTYKIKLIHCSDCTFLAIPLDKRGKLAREEFCRRSNGLKKSISSLVSEVLEASEPREIFSW